MAKCIACELISIRKRGERGHEELLETGPKSGYKPPGQAGVVISHFACRACGTKWSYENDKNDDFVGWSEE